MVGVDLPGSVFLVPSSYQPGDCCRQGIPRVSVSHLYNEHIAGGTCYHLVSPKEVDGLVELRGLP